MNLQAITDKTLLPISLVIVVIGGVFWLSTVYNDGRYTKERVTTLETRIGSVEGKLQVNETTQAGLIVKLDNIEKSLEELKKLLTDRILPLSELKK